jgi:hypothetical protein
MDDEDRTLPGPPPARKIAEANTVALDERPRIADDDTALGPLDPVDVRGGAAGFVAHATNAEARTDLELEPPPSVASYATSASPIAPAVTTTLRPGDQPPPPPQGGIDITAPMQKVAPSTPARPRSPTLLRVLVVAAIALAVGLLLVRASCRP